MRYIQRVTGGHVINSKFNIIQVYDNAVRSLKVLREKFFLTRCNSKNYFFGEIRCRDDGGIKVSA